MQKTAMPWRQIAFKFHLYLAMTLGLLFAAMGLTGSIAVYGDAVDELLNPKLVIDQPQEKYQSLDRIMAAVRAAHPERRGPWILDMPRTPESMLTAWYERPGLSESLRNSPLMVSVNPYTADVVASRVWGETAVTWLLDLHTQLHSGRLGWNAVGWLGLALLLSTLAGLCLWWPGLGGWRRALTVRHDGGANRLALDLHRLVGLVSAGVLLIVAFTGFNLVFPKPSELLAGASGMSHGDDGPNVRSSAIPNDRPVGLDEAVLLARGPFPHAVVRRVVTPDGADGTYRVYLRQRSEVNQRHPMTTVWLDRHSGQIREVRNPARLSAGETALTWLWPLHTGEAFGPWGRFLWCLAGLSPALLYVTGMLRWLVARGWLRDFKVDLSPVGRAFERMGAVTATWGGAACHRSRPVLLEAKDVLLGWFKRGMRWFQGKPGETRGWW
ncbi:PepSY-associated TM helix domain-containing protein [Methylomagnum sp.]